MSAAFRSNAPRSTMAGGPGRLTCSHSRPAPRIYEYCPVMKASSGSGSAGTGSAGPRVWRNWAGTATAAPARWCRPRNEGEISAAVKDAASAGLTVRALGSGHSFTAAAATSGVALDLSQWTGITAADTGTGLVTARSGTTLRALGAELGGLGLAMANLGDIDAQTLAGALSTGTHGTGARLGGLATQVESVELVLADGSVATCSASSRPELFAAARIGLGALGVITTVTLRCVPSFTLLADERPMPVEEVLEQFDALAAANDHFEFYWFPYGRKALVKRNNRLPGGGGAAAAPAPPPLRAWRRFWEFEVMENAAFGALCRLGRARPRLIPALNRFSSAALSTRTYTDTSHRVFVTPRRVRFAESEYAVPRESLAQVVTELRRAVPRLHHPVMFPVEVRVAAAGSRPTSPSTSTPGCPTRNTSTGSSPSWPRWPAGHTGASCIRSTPGGSARSIPASMSSAASGPRSTRKAGSAT